MFSITFIMMIGFGGFGAWVLYGSRALIELAWASYGWSETEGTIVDSLDDSFVTPGINQWDAGVVPVNYKETGHVFEYQADGRKYRSNNYCFGSHFERAQAAFLIGTKVKVYYDPHDPKLAVLKRGVQPSMLIGPILLAAALYMAIKLYS